MDESPTTPPASPESKAQQLAEHLFRHESGKMVAILVGIYGPHCLQMAEDAVQEAMIRALRSWPLSALPDNPPAWLLRTAKNLMTDQLRREKFFEEKQPEIVAGLESSAASEEDNGFSDDQLRLMFVCCHPSLPQNAQAALALKTLCGFSPLEIARAFLISEAAVNKRLTRARERVRELSLPFAVPEPQELPERLDGVLGTLYLLFNEGYKASAGDRLVREDLCHEAIRILTLLTQHPVIQEPRAFALLALMLLTAARLPARTNANGDLQQLHEQDRSVWDQQMIQQGIQCLARSADGVSVTPYHLEAAIASCHSTAATANDTDWQKILHLYDQLMRQTSSPIAAMNRAVAVARVHGPKAGQDALTHIAQHDIRTSSHLFHAIQGSLASELGDFHAAQTHYQKALGLAELPAERAFIERRLKECMRHCEAMDWGKTPEA